MNNTQQEQEAPAELQVANLLVSLSKKQEKMTDIKSVLKNFPVKSDRLNDLKKARKEMSEQIKQEIDDIESELYEDKDFETARNDELTIKNEIKEVTGMLKVALRSKYEMKDVQTEDHNIQGEQLKMQLEFVPRVYINGRELK